MLVTSAELLVGVTVDPHCVLAGGVQGFCVVSPSGRVAGSPAFDQLMARLVERTPDHGCCAWTKAENESDVQVHRRKDKRGRQHFMQCFLGQFKTDRPAKSVTIE